MMDREDRLRRGRLPERPRRLFLLLLGLACLGLLLISLPYIVNSSRVKGYICGQLGQLLNREVYLHQLRLHLWPPLSIELQGLMVKQEGEVLLLIDSSYFTLSMKELLRGRLAFEAVRLERLTLSLKQGLPPLQIVRGGLRKGLFRGSFRIKRMEIRDGRVVIENPGLWPLIQPILILQEVNIRASMRDQQTCHFQLQAKYQDTRINLRGNLSLIGGGVGTNRPGVWMTTRFHIASLDLKKILPLPDKYGLKGHADIRGSFRLQPDMGYACSLKINLTHWGFRIPSLFERPFYWNKGGLRGRLAMGDQGHIELAGLILDLGGMTMTGYGHLRRGNFYLKLGSHSPLEMATLKDYLPRHGLPAPVINFIERNMREGRIDDFTLELGGHFKGLTNSPGPAVRYDQIVAQAHLSGVELIFAEHFQPVTQLQGVIRWQGGHLDLQGLTGKYRDHSLLMGEGRIEDLLGSPLLRLSVRGSIRVEELATDLAGNDTAPPFLQVLARQGQPAGPAWLKLELSHPLLTDQPLNIQGYIELLGARVDYTPLRQPLWGLQGGIMFNRDSIRTEAIQGQWGQSLFLLRGNIGNYNGNDPSVRLRIFSEPDIQQLKGLYPPLFAKLVWQGRPYLVLDLVRKAGQWSMRFDLDLTSMAYHYRGIGKEEEIPNRLRCLLRPRGLDGWKIDSLIWELDGLELSGQGEFLLPLRGKGPHWSLHLSGRELGLGRLWSLWQGGKDSPLRGSLGLEINWEDHSPPRIEVQLKAQQADLDRLWRPGSLGDMSLLPDLSLRGDIQIEEGTFHGLQLSQIQIQLTSDKGRWEIERFRVNLANGWFQGEGFIDSGPPADPYQLYLRGWGRKMDIAELIQGLAQIKSILTGSLNLALELEGKRDSLQGKISLKVKRGVLKKYSFLAKIFSFLNISQLLELQLPNLFVQGMPYKVIRGDFQIRGGIAYTDKLFLESSSVNMAAIGQIDLRKRVLDLTVAVQPLQTIDKVIALMPLLGYLLTDEKNSLIFALFKVEGPWTNPSVTPIPLASIQKGLLGIIKRILLLPKEIITRDKEPWEILLPKLP